jgi:hypothetical protein
VSVILRLLAATQWYALRVQRRNAQRGDPDLQQGQEGDNQHHYQHQEQPVRDGKTAHDGEGKKQCRENQ